MVRRCAAVMLALALVGCRDRWPGAMARRIAPDPTTLGTSLPVGTEHPYQLIAADPRERWVALCQAREDTDGDGRVSVWQHAEGTRGDRMRPYLVEGHGAGEPIDALLGSDETGRFVAVIRAGRRMLLDSETRVWRDLDALDDSDDPSRSRVAPVVPGAVAQVPPPRDGESAPEAISFAQNLALFPQRPSLARPGVSAWLLDLSTGTAWSLDLGRAPVGDAQLSEDAHWVETWGARSIGPPSAPRIPSDSEWKTRRSWGRNACESDDRSIVSLFRSLDPPARRFHVRTGAMRYGGGVEATMGDRLVRKQPDGSFALEDLDGGSETLVPADCQGPIVAHSARHEVVVASCASGRRAFYRRGGSRSVGPRRARDGRRRSTAFDASIELASGQLFEPAAWEFSELPGGDVCRVTDAWVLVSRPGLGTYLHDRESRQESLVSREPCDLGRRRGTFVALGHEAFDTRTAAVVGAWPVQVAPDDPPIEEVSEQGRALAVTPAAAQRFTHALEERERRPVADVDLNPTGGLVRPGPLAWVAPQRIKPTAAPGVSSAAP